MAAVGILIAKNSVPRSDGGTGSEPCTVIGVLRLLQAGHAGPAAMVLRSLFETAVNLQVILKEDVLARCQLFEDFLFMERENTDGTEEQKAANKAAADRVRMNYHPTHPYSWCWKIVRPKKPGKGRVPGRPEASSVYESGGG
jgi:hypothetical protein